MNKAILGAVLTAGLVLGMGTASFAAGDGLDRDAASTGNSTFAGQHRNAAGGAMTVGRAITGPRLGSRPVKRHRHHRRHR